jgi:GTP diphosphokinase / guanosine-3',5'-bis(diphosphate) 3'-diphosphatase
MENVTAEYSRLERMIRLACERHAGQFDKAGKPYVLHLLRVMNGLRHHHVSRQVIAMGHDLIEDTKTTFKELEDMHFSDREIDGIRALTKFPGSTEEEQLLQVMCNIDACYVKLEDLRDNSDITRLKGVTQKDIDRIVKYQRWYLQIRSKIADFEAKVIS